MAEGSIPHFFARLLAEPFDAFDFFKGSAVFFDFDLEARRTPGTLPIRGSPTRTSSQARSAAASKSGASAGRTCQPVTGFPNT
jgi:hypothetical protein